MKFIINSLDLLKEVQKLSGVLSNSNTLPILDNFLFEISKSNLHITASDLETTMTCNISMKANEEGSIAMPAKLLMDTLKTFSNQPLTFLINKDNFNVEINSENGIYKLAGQNASEFPKTPSMNEGKKISINSMSFVNAVNKTLFACGNDELRPVMSGLYCELNAEKISNQY